MCFCPSPDVAARVLLPMQGHCSVLLRTKGAEQRLGSEGVNAKADLSGEVSRLGCEGWMPPGFLSSGTPEGSSEADLGGQSLW